MNEREPWKDIDLRAIEGEDYEEKFGNTLTVNEASFCLSCVGPTFRCYNGMKSFIYPTFAYIAMEVRGRNITDISVLPIFAHVVFLDLTNNRLTDKSLTPLEFMKQLKVLIIDNNFVENLSALPELNNLQLFSVKYNSLSTCEVRKLDSLLYLDLSYNNISTILPHLWCPYLLPKIRELSMRGNGLKKLAGFLFPNLVSLFLADNQIKKIEGLELLTNLKFLHLRNNPLDNLKGFSGENKKLFYINLRDCKITKESEFKNLKNLPRLERIVVEGNPFWKLQNSRLKLIGVLPSIRRINKTVVEDFEREEAVERGFGKKDSSTTGVKR